MSEKDLNDGYQALLKENEALKARIRELEESNQKLVEERFAAMSVNGKN